MTDEQFGQGLGDISWLHSPKHKSNFWWSAPTPWQHTGTARATGDLDLADVEALQALTLSAPR